MTKRDQSEWQAPIVIILAAGVGSRFTASGGQGEKLEALLHGISLREHVMEKVKVSGLPFHVVQRQHTAHLTNPGMGDSIACGVAATANANGWLILPADLPLIRSSTILAVAQALAQHRIVAPYFENVRGHPVGFSRQHYAQLCQLSGEVGARKLMAHDPPFHLVCDDEGCVLDVDTVQALQVAQMKLQK